MGERLDRSSRVKQNPGVLSAEVGEAVVLLHAERNAYFDMDAVGAEVWRRIGEPTAIGDVCQALEALYEVDAATCEADVVAFLEDAVAQGIVLVDDDTPAQP